MMATIDEEITEEEFNNFKCECPEDIHIPDGLIEALNNIQIDNDISMDFGFRGSK